MKEFSLFITFATRRRTRFSKARAQSKPKDDFLVAVFDFVRSIALSVIGHRKCAGPVNEIETSA